MSELTTPIRIDIPGVGSIESADLYLKSEVDEVIAELEESHKKEVGQLLIEISELKETLKNSRNAHKYWRKEYLIEYKECLHNKHKRCLAMARIAKDDWHLHNSFYAMGHQEFEKRKCEFYEKWRQRWLELAKKFKEAK